MSEFVTFSFYGRIQFSSWTIVHITKTSNSEGTIFFVEHILCKYIGTILLTIMKKREKSYFRPLEEEFFLGGFP